MRGLRKKTLLRFVPCPPAKKYRHKSNLQNVTDSDSSDDAENNTPKPTPRYYPRYPLESVTLMLGDADRCKAARVKTRVPSLKPLDLNFLECPTWKIVETLLAADCSLSDVVCLQNAEWTRAFLQKMPWTGKYNFEEQEPWVDPYAAIDADSRYSVDLVMNSLDVQNAKVILTCGPGRYLRKRHFFYNIVAMATERRNLKTLEVFVRRILEWNILDREASRIIEQGVFQKADKQVLRIFLQSRLDFYVNHMFGVNMVAALFANPSVKIGALKRKRLFDVETAGYDNFTALHYAMVRKDFKKIKFLLDRGADPNVSTRRHSTPLMLAWWEPAENPVDNAKCAELLLQYGADPFWETTCSCCMGFFYLYLATKGELDGRASAVFGPAAYLMELFSAYCCMYEADGAGNILILTFIVPQVQVEGNPNFYSKCQHELRMLKEHKIRRDLTMFTVASRTGQHLFRLVNEEDYKMITSYIDKYRKDMTINPFYVNAMREHMRQFRKLVAHRNRAMLVISESAKALAPYSIVLIKIVGYLTYTDLLKFQ